MKQVAGLLLGVLVLVMSGATLLAHEETYMGTVISAGAAKVQVKVIDEKSKKETTMDFAVTTKTKVFRGEKSMPFADARVQKDERIAVTVNHDVSATDAVAIRLATKN